jgi:oxygen-dependent protoporphyrinogen oxidase
MAEIPAAIHRAIEGAAPGTVRTGVTVDAASLRGLLAEARRVVLAVPAWRQATLVADLAPHAASVLAAVRYSPIAVVAVGIRPGGSPPIPEAFGFLRGRGAPARILGATFLSCLSPSSAPPGHALILVYLGGMEDAAVLDRPDDFLADLALRDLSRALGGPVRPDMLDVCRHPRAIPLFSPGHRGRMAQASADLDPLRLRLSGSHVTGVGLDRCASPDAPLRSPLPSGARLG